MSVRFLRPTRTTLVALVGLLWAISFGALRDFVWADLRGGLIRLYGLSRAVRFQVILGFLLLLCAVALLLFHDTLRTQFRLTEGVVDIVGRGNLIPTVLLPAGLLAMAVAWSYILAGALRVRRLLGSVPLFLYVTTAIGVLGAALDLDPSISWLGWGALVVLVLLFVIPATCRLPVDVAFLIMLVLVGIQYGVVQTRILAQDRVSGLGLGQLQIESSIESLQDLVLPLLLVIGMDIARFTQQAATWTVQVVRRRLADALAYVALVFLLGYLLYMQVGALQAAIGEIGRQAALAAYAGGLGIPAGIVLVWAVIERIARRAKDPSQKVPNLTSDEMGERAEGVVLWVVAARTATVMLAFLLLHLQGTIAAVAFQLSGQAQNVALITMALVGAAAEWVGSIFDVWLWIVAVGSLVIGIVLAWRRAASGSTAWRAIALYLAAHGVMGIWLNLTVSNGPLNALEAEDQAMVHFWWVLLVAGAALVWLARRTLTPARAGRLAFLLMILLLLEQTNFIENPFSPFFGFAGIGFVAFGIIWDALTAGSWANVETRGLPRTGRIFLYVGYVLLTVTLVNWALTTHNLDIAARFSGGTALIGLELLGKPLLYLLFPLMLVLPAKLELDEAEEGDQEEAARNPVDADAGSTSSIQS